jgi:tRNA threonylcarbamoyladenosine biosynthesis protein TsaB
MRLLALDTATEACSVALICDGAVIARFAEVGRGHAEQVLGMVDEVLTEAGVTLAQLDGLAASVGPGAFTGVRISVAVAQGLAFGANLPVVAVSTLEALALQALDAGAECALACLDARMGELYWGCFAADPQRLLVACGAARVGPADGVALAGGAPHRGIGRGFAAYPELGNLPGLVLDAADARALPDGRAMARLGAVRLRAGEGRDAAELTPQYLRDKVALTEAERAAARAQVP